MIRTWQDYDENCRTTWGMWFGSLSNNGHVVMIVGPFDTKEECISKLGE